MHHKYFNLRRYYDVLSQGAVLEWEIGVESFMTRSDDTQNQKTMEEIKITRVMTLCTTVPWKLDHTHERGLTMITSPVVVKQSAPGRL